VSHLVTSDEGTLQWRTAKGLHRAKCYRAPRQKTHGKEFAVRSCRTAKPRFSVVLPLTPDPPVLCFWKWIGWKDYKVKNRYLVSVSVKNIMFLLPTVALPTHLVPTSAHPRIASLKKSFLYAPVLLPPVSDLFPGFEMGGGRI
jgi:hypothetical protein